MQSKNFIITHLSSYFLGFGGFDRCCPASYFLGFGPWALFDRNEEAADYYLEKPENSNGTCLKKKI